MITQSPPAIAKGVQTSMGSSAVLEQDAEKMAAAARISEEEQKKIAEAKVTKPKEGTAFYTSLWGSKFIASDGVVLEFHGYEMIVKKQEYIDELRAVSRTGGPIWEAKEEKKI